MAKPHDWDEIILLPRPLLVQWGWDSEIAVDSAPVRTIASLVP